MENKIEIDVGWILTIIYSSSWLKYFTAAHCYHKKLDLVILNFCQRARPLAEATVAKLGGQNQITFRSII